jgi:CHRD domain-containing protein
MKRYLLVGVAILAAACGSSNSTPAPTPLPTSIVFTAALSASNEVPPITNADSNGKGSGTFTLNLTRDGAGNITAAKGTFVYNLSGFPAGTTVRATHIHEGGPGIGNGTVKIDSGLTAANAFALNPDGSIGNQTFADKDVDVALANLIIANPNGYYFNVHTALNPGGAVRAQLVKQ